MYPPRAAGLALALLLCVGARPLLAQDDGDEEMNPLSAADQARVEQLLQGFDPNSYELKTHVMNPDGSVQPRAVGQAKGLASLQQLETERPGATGVAKTNTNINIFSQAKTNTNINIFREAAATNTNINLFRDADQQNRAMEINSILQRYVSAPSGPTAMAANPRLRAAPVAGRELTPSRQPTPTRELNPNRELSPLSAPDQARVEQLLQSFDPNSYDLRTHVMNPDGSVQPRMLGQAKGLASLQQVETRRAGVRGEAQAKTNTNINIFSQAKTNTNINIFREALASTNTNINLFRDARQQQSAMEINAILQKYLTAP